MSLITELVCVQCGAYLRGGPGIHLPALWTGRRNFGGPIRSMRGQPKHSRAAVGGSHLSHWRYRELLPLNEGFCPTSGSLGWTPIIEAPRLAKALGIGRLRLKDEGRNPSGSFKDRPSSVGVARAMQEGFHEVACASTGNAATSLAYSAAVAGLLCNIFVAKFVPQGKLAQLLAYGARVFRVQGSYAQAYDLCTQACQRFGWYNRNAAVNPYLVEGKKTGGMEVAEQCADDPPDWVVCSVGDGCSIAGVYKGMVELKSVGITDWAARMLGVQADGVAPIAKAFEMGHLDRSDTGDTYADSINCPSRATGARPSTRFARVVAPTSPRPMPRSCRPSASPADSRASSLSQPPQPPLPASVLPDNAGYLNPKSNVLAMITGTGLKDIQGALLAVGEPFDVSPTLDTVLKIVESNPWR